MGVGSLRRSETKRKMFAQQFWSINAANKEFKDLFPEFGAPQPDQTASSAETKPQTAAAVAEVEPPAAAPGVQTETLIDDQASSGAEAEAPIEILVAEPEPSIEDDQCWICLQSTQE